ncbi:GntR family transcriptional regulator [Pseudonocardia humida]|uniref:GntR family transcriptional regulator n=1 Tax=Pseudonocardia humida TaxID=2800819 RepID=A0ABT1A0Y7_9PSEU|nr:GntR family transcriptional regulator [Pseudonocardia humida]MCO1656479.1 GntR family transcriptional regulator [Pseudonocardia humida]
MDQVAARIRERILSGDIPIGAQLRQAELAVDFGVSRMPVREALRQLQTGGLIEVHPNRGAVVRVPAPWEVRETYEVRAELEALAARRAVRRITPAHLDQLRVLNLEMRRRADAGGADPDPEPTRRHRGNEDFHTVIAACSGNHRLHRAIDELHAAYPRNILARLLVDDPRYCADNFTEHDRIVGALAAGDAAAAGSLMREHVVQAGEQLARWFEQRSSTVFRGVPG